MLVQGAGMVDRRPEMLPRLRVLRFDIELHETGRVPVRLLL